MIILKYMIEVIWKLHANYIFHSQILIINSCSMTTSFLSKLLLDMVGKSLLLLIRRIDLERYTEFHKKTS